MKRRRMYSDSEVEENFWPSFTDLISTIALILFFLVLLIFVKEIVVGKNFKSLQIKMEEELALKNAEIQKTEKNLLLLKDELDDIMAEVEKGQIALKLSEKQIDDQKKIIAESNQELGDLRSKLRGVALIRVNVLNQVKDAIEKQLGTDNNGNPIVAVADNGNLILNEGILFDTGSYTIKNDSKPLLDKLAKSFEAILNDEETRKFIDAIEIQGHADARGDVTANSRLSSNRATAVVDYLMKGNPILKDKYGEYFAASGYSIFRPIEEGNNAEAWKANRRIEISVILKDPSIRELIDEYLSDSEKLFEEKEEEKKED